MTHIVKTYFLPAHLKFDVQSIEKYIGKLPNKVGLITTIQYIDQLEEVHALLQKHNKDSVNLGQILGCNWDNLKKSNEFDAFFYIGSGRFHPVGVGMLSEKQIFTYNPETDTFGTLDRTDVDAFKKKIRILQTKFLSSTHIGVLISIKEGQMNVHSAQFLEQQFPDKKFYFFACNTLDYNELENYPFIDTWVNTMCPRIGTDDHFKVRKGMVNIKDLAPFMKKTENKA